MTPHLRIARTLTRIAARVIRDVADAPRVARELRAIRAEQRHVPAPLTVDDITGDVPDVETIEAAAKEYEQARQATNAAARIKRAAEKILKRTPDGVYGRVSVERFESSRLVADLDRIREIFKAHGLGEPPMKRCAPSLTLTWIEEIAHPEAETFAVAA